ncbi:MAG TPA: glycoside hydrolase family 76 protein [Pseudonocardiaceae bacterium]|nr:glycoside hydrolase family 76 protein [Pseudonocardiaceae bacterium]
MTEQDTRRTSPALWAARAAVAERAVYARHLRRLWALPGTMLGVVCWPSTAEQRCFGHWNYWWQAHLLDCLVDAARRDPKPAREESVRRVVHGIHRRNLGSWLNPFYDDVAWLGLALLRAQQAGLVSNGPALAEIAARLRSGWTDHSGGGIWWRVGSDFKNVPANGPAAILLARLSDMDIAGAGERADRQRARSTVDWIETNLLDSETGLVSDGLHVEPDGSIRDVEKNIYTYCQGVFLGACLELAGRDGAGTAWATRAVRTIDAVAQRVTVPDGTASDLVIRGQGGGDGGLFAGILARYLALAATVLPGISPDLAEPAKLASSLVFSSAEAAWRNRAIAPGGPLFGPDWTKPAVLPRQRAKPEGHLPERDLSVQLGAWMLLEAAACLEGKRAPGAHRQ